MTKTKEQIWEQYPQWSDSKKRKYNHVILLKYGSHFLRSLQIAARNAQRSHRQTNLSTPQGHEVAGLAHDLVTSKEDQASSRESDPPVTDVEVLAPVSKLPPDEIFSVKSDNSEAKVGPGNQHGTQEIVPSEKNLSGAAKLSHSIDAVTLDGAVITSTDSLIHPRVRESIDLSPEEEFAPKVSNRRKRKTPKRIVKRQRVYEGDGDTSEESNADVRNKFLTISLDEEDMDDGKEGQVWNTSDECEKASSVELHHERREEEELEGDVPTLGVSKNNIEEADNTSLVSDTLESELNSPNSSLVARGREKERDEHLELSREGETSTPAYNGGSIPKRKTARKKPGFSSLRSETKIRNHSGGHTSGIYPALRSSASKIGIQDGEDGKSNKATSPMKSESKSLEVLKEKVLTGESPKLKVVCSQVVPSALGGNEKDDGRKNVAALFHRAQNDILLDTEKGETPRTEKGSTSEIAAVDTPMDGAQVQNPKKTSVISSQDAHSRDISHQGNGELSTSPKNMEVEYSGTVTRGMVHVETPERTPLPLDAAEMQSDDTQLSLTQVQGIGTPLVAITPSQLTEIEAHTTEENPPPSESNRMKKERRDTIWEGSLRQHPSKVKFFQIPFNSDKKKKQFKEGSNIERTEKQTGTPAKQRPVDRKEYRKVAIPPPMSSPNISGPNAVANEDKGSPTKMEESLTKWDEYSPGNLVWGRMKGFPWWPGMIVHHYAMKRRESPPPGHIVIQWFGDMKFSQLKFDQVCSFTKQFKENINMVFVKKRNLYKKALYQALKVASLQAKKSFGDVMPEFPKKDTTEEDQKIFESTFNDMMLWAEESFHDQDVQDLVPLPEHTTRPPTPPPSSPKRSTEEKKSAKENEKWVDCRDQRFIELKKGEISLEEFCIGCGSKSLTHQHPLFVGGLCEVCRIEYLETAYMFADDGYQCYCCICAEGNELALCENKGCYRSFCMTCVELMISTAESKKIKSQDPWVCYMCQPQKTFGHLQIRDNWPHLLHELFGKDHDVDFAPLRTWPPKPLEERKPIRVLSLFDGIGTGMFVLKELGFKVEVYIASEVNPDAIKVSSVRQKGAITQVGDVRRITSKELAEWGPFDLLIGGSPCNDLSIVNPARKGIYGGTGVLFFEYWRILRQLQQTTPPDRPLFWFFENVVFMEHQDKMTISRFFECNPVLVDAKDLSPAHRARYFWGNLPGMDRPSAALMDSPLRLQDCLEPHCNRKAKFSKVRTITTRANSLKQGEASFPVEMDGKEDTLWCTELERLFGFPDHYTDVNNLSRGDRQKLLGQCWSVPVIHHLLAPLKDYYQCQ